MTAPMTGPMTWQDRADARIGRCPTCDEHTWRGRCAGCEQEHYDAEQRSRPQKENQ